MEGDAELTADRMEDDAQLTDRMEGDAHLTANRMGDDAHLTANRMEDDAQLTANRMEGDAQLTAHRMEDDAHLTEAVQRSRWSEVTRLLRDSSSLLHPRPTRRLAMQRTAQHAPERFVLDILDVCTEDDLEAVMPHLLHRLMWRCVHLVLQRDINWKLRREIVNRALKNACGYDFLHYVLPHCSTEELEQGLEPLIKHGQWLLVGKVLDRGINSAQRRLAVEKALGHADDDEFVNYIFQYCSDRELEAGLPCLVSRRLWKSVGKVLQRGISETRRHWAAAEGMQHAEDLAFTQHVLPHCLKAELEDWLPQLVSRRLWRSVGKVLHQRVRPELHRWAVTQALNRADDADMNQFILQHCSQEDRVALFPCLVASRKWRCAHRVLYEVAMEALCAWMTSAHEGGTPNTLVRKLLNCPVEMSEGLNLIKTATRYSSFTTCKEFALTSFVMSARVSCRKQLLELLTLVLLLAMSHAMLREGGEHIDCTDETPSSVRGIYAHITACVKDNAGSIQNKKLTIFQNKTRWTTVFSELADAHKNEPFFLFHFLKCLNLYYTNRRGKEDDDILVVIFTILPLFPLLQSVAIKKMLAAKRWDVIGQACLSHLWEHDRRQVFKAAVEQRQWGVVRQWADHSLHDDQRDWAMKEAFRERQWRVYLLLADHGLTMREHMHACYILAKYGDWDTVLEMVERGGDITEVSNLLENWVTGQLRKKPQGDVTVFYGRCKKLIRLMLRFVRNSTLSPSKVLRNGMWGSVLFSILHDPTEEYFSQVLHKVLQDQEWHILMHLVRLGMTPGERDWLFPQMVRQQQWGVCRKLLEMGVDVRLCLEALPELLEKKQWTLVARVMEYSVDDAVRCQVMQCAFQRREGVLFWHCLSTMENQDPLPVAVQRTLFHQALGGEMWQAVKPLMVEQDVARAQHRDLAFLEALDQHLWDVVDHCQVLGADINMEDEDGETPLHREARKKEWKAVEEIVFRDGNPNRLDRDGVGVLNRLILYSQRDREKTVIKYGGDIHLPAKCTEHWYIEDSIQTPLQALIEHRHVDVIQFTVKWCPEQRSGVNEKGETALHAACDSALWGGLEDLMVRQVDPLAVTRTGQTALLYAVLNPHCPHRMVAECCRLGFSMHQTLATGPQDSVLDDVISTVTGLWGDQVSFQHCSMHYGAITSPFVCALLSDLPEVALMLYESGASSSSELLALGKQLPKLTDLGTVEGRMLHEEGLRHWHGPDNFKRCYCRMTRIVEKYLALLRSVVTTPRTLLSSCRLWITRRLHYSDKKRLERVDLLPLSAPLKNYLLFSDFCDPDYGQDRV